MITTGRNAPDTGYILADIKRADSTSPENFGADCEGLAARRHRPQTVETIRNVPDDVDGAMHRYTVLTEVLTERSGIITYDCIVILDGAQVKYLLRRRVG